MTTRYTTHLLLLILTVSSCTQSSSSDDSAPASSHLTITHQQFDSSEMTLGQAQEHTFYTTLNVSGSLRLPPQSQVAVSTLLGGSVSHMDWQEGQAVKKGAALFSITNPALITLQRDYLVARSKAAYLQAEYRRQENLAADRLTTQTELLSVQSALLSAEATYTALRETLDLYGIDSEAVASDHIMHTITVRSPVSGYISTLHIAPGSYLQAGQTALSISDPDQLQLHLYILHHDAAHVVVGQRVHFVVSGDTAGYHTAQIEQVNSGIGSEHIVTAIARIDQPQNTQHLPGMYTTAQVLVDSLVAYSLPEQAIIQTGSTKQVLRLSHQDSSGYHLVPTIVNTGMSYKGAVALPEITTSDDTYLIHGAYQVLQ